MQLLKCKKHLPTAFLYPFVNKVKKQIPLDSLVMGATNEVLTQFLSAT